MLKKIIRIVSLLVKFILNVLGSFVSLFYGFISLVVFFFFGGCIVVFLIYMHVKPELESCREKVYNIISNVEESDFFMPADTIIYDKDGTVIGHINAGHYEYVKINDINMNLQNAYISQEDKRFKEHGGVDWISTFRAGLALLKNRGEITQGGSTITQQVIKNTYLTQEKTFERKMIEIMLAPQIEAKFTKSQIMEYYCNTNFYGNDCYGVEAASRYYFGKPASALSISESCLLVGISNSPANYDPIKKPDAALDKRNEIITNMYDNGFISLDEKKLAIKEPLDVEQNDFPGGFETYQSSYAIHCAALKLMQQEGFKFEYTYKDKSEYEAYVDVYGKKYGEMVDKIRKGGYEIYTTLDSKIQKIAQENIDNILKRFSEKTDEGKFALQGAAVIADNQTGNVVAIVGGRGTEDMFNRGFQSARQPGSSIKPIIDYAPAIETGLYYPSKILDDHEIPDGPKNSGGGYRGNVSMREALNRSINTIAWQLIENIGTEKALSYLDKMEFRKISYVDNATTAISIGGFTNGLRVVDMAKGFQTLANDGVYNNKTCITDIKNQSGESIIKENEDVFIKVFEPETAYIVTDMLKDCIDKKYGTGHGLALNNMPAAGKTGTTNDNKDTWFCGYTKYYTAAVWVGYDMPRPMPGVYGATYAGRIWKNIMNDIHKGFEPSDWICPEGVVQMQYKEDSGEPINDTSEAIVDGNVKPGYEIFSLNATKKAEEHKVATEKENNINRVKSMVDDYINHEVSDISEYFLIDENYNIVVNTLYIIEDSKIKTELYDMIQEKYESLKTEKELIKDDLDAYERRLKQEEEDKKIQARNDDIAAKQESLKKSRIAEFDKCYRIVASLEYNPDTNEFVDNAKAALEKLKEYDEYIDTGNKLLKEIDRLKTLPSYEEWKAMKASEQAQIEEEKRIEETKKNELEQKINNSNQTVPETKQVETQPFGPGYVLD